MTRKIWQGITLRRLWTANLPSVPPVSSVPDGTFTLETLHAGTIFKGAREGTYRVRIVPGDEDDNGKKLKKPPVAAKHLKFETSGLTFQVPASGDVTLEFSAR